MPSHSRMPLVPHAPRTPRVPHACHACLLRPACPAPGPRASHTMHRDLLHRVPRLVPHTPRVPRACLMHAPGLAHPCLAHIAHRASRTMHHASRTASRASRLAPCANTPLRPRACLACIARRACIAHRIPCIASYASCLAPCALYMPLMPCPRASHRASCIMHLTPCLMHRVSCITSGVLCASHTLMLHACLMHACMPRSHRACLRLRIPHPGMPPMPRVLCPPRAPRTVSIHHVLYIVRVPRMPCVPRMPRMLEQECGTTASPCHRATYAQPRISPHMHTHP
jgi:hypothetical protein